MTHTFADISGAWRLFKRKVGRGREKGEEREKIKEEKARKSVREKERKKTFYQDDSLRSSSFLEHPDIMEIFADI